MEDVRVVARLGDEAAAGTGDEVEVVPGVKANAAQASRIDLEGRERIVLGQLCRTHIISSWR